MRYCDRCEVVPATLPADVEGTRRGYERLCQGCADALAEGQMVVRITLVRAAADTGKAHRSVRPHLLTAHREILTAYDKEAAR